MREFTYVPEGDSPYDEITVNANANAADILCAATLAAYSSAENTVCSEQMSMDLDGREVLYFTYQREYADETADGSETTAAEGDSAADGSTADDGGDATDGSTADDASATDSTAADDTSAADGTVADGASATDDSAADDASTTDSAADDAPPQTALRTTLPPPTAPLRTTLPPPMMPMAQLRIHRNPTWRKLSICRCSTPMCPSAIAASSFTCTTIPRPKRSTSARTNSSL